MSMQQWIIHIDMDAFFASVEQLLAPELKGKPVIVGHDNRGVVCAASYEARVFGVRSAMPTVHARRLCPHGIFVPPRQGTYAEISREVIEVFHNFSPIVEQASIDEAYIDASGLDGLFGSPEELGHRIKDAVFEKTGLTCSVGIAPVKFLAKIASDINKPNGLYIIESAQIADFLYELPVRKIPGVGPRTQEILTKLGVKTAGDVLRLPPGILESRLGKLGESILRRAQGLDSSKVEPHNVPKSEGREHTLDNNTKDRELLKKYLLHQSERVMSGVRKMGTAGRTVTLKVKFSDFKQITRSHTFDYPTSSTRLVYSAACKLLDKLVLDLPVRLIGVSLSNFVWTEKDFISTKNEFLPGLDIYFEQLGKGTAGKSSGKLETLPESGSADKASNADLSLDATIDQVRGLFGRDVIKYANLLDDWESEDK